MSIHVTQPPSASVITPPDISRHVVYLHRTAACGWQATKWRLASAFKAACVRGGEAIKRRGQGRSVSLGSHYKAGEIPAQPNGLRVIDALVCSKTRICAVIFKMCCLSLSVLAHFRLRFSSPPLQRRVAKPDMIVDGSDVMDRRARLVSDMIFHERRRFPRPCFLFRYKLHVIDWCHSSRL